MIFNPSLDYGVADGFYDLVEMLISDSYKMASLVKRLAEHNGREHYQVCMRISAKSLFFEVQCLLNILNLFVGSYRALYKCLDKTSMHTT